jgi:NMD protein affecting ribosome stability and mRNA decay
MGIKTKFCAVCGKEGKSLIDSKCPECFFKSLKIDLPKKIILYACPICDAVFYNGIWYESPESHEEFFIKAILEKLKLPQGVELDDIKILQTGKEGRVELDLSIKGNRFTAVIPIELYITDKVCKTDAAKKRGAYEGILQLRGDLKKIESAIAQIPTTNILEIENLRAGKDVYFLDVDSLRDAVAKLKHNFRIEIKQSAKAYSWDKTKNKPKYKITILARFL